MKKKDLKLIKHRFFSGEKMRNSIDFNHEYAYCLLVYRREFLIQCAILVSCFLRTSLFFISLFLQRIHRILLFLYEKKLFHSILLFQFPNFCVSHISKTKEVRNLKHTPKVAHIIHMQPV